MTVLLERSKGYGTAKTRNNDRCMALWCLEPRKVRMEPLFDSDPTQLGEWKILGRLGSGGFGVVFEAISESGEKVAIKLLRPELSDDKRLRDRLEREAEALGRVQGERTVKVLEVVTEGDHAYLVMEMLMGETLSGFVSEKGPLEGPLLWFAAGGLVEALQDIHAAGVLHRDLKPSNVIYGPDGIKVLDFGISGIAEETGLTQTGAFLGTAAWISPEQVLGKKATTESDVFNLGLVVAFASTGEHPFGTGRSDAVMFRIANSEPNLENVPEIIREVVERCLCKSPSGRPTLSDLIGFFGSDGNQKLPEMGAGTSEEGSTVIVQPKDLPSVEKIAKRTRSKSRPSFKQKPPRKKRSLVLWGLWLLIVGGLVAGYFSGFMESEEDKEIVATTAPATTAPATTAPATTAPATTVVLAPVTTSTTTLPPVFKLYKIEGKAIRFNPCQVPVHVNLNPNGELSSQELASLELFLIWKSNEISEATGLNVLYMGLHSEVPTKAYQRGEDIDIFIGEPGSSPLLEESRQNAPFSTWFSYDRNDGTFWEMDAVQVHVNSKNSYLDDWFENDGQMTEYGEWIFMHILGAAFGLEWLFEEDFGIPGTPSQQQREQMKNEIMHYSQTRLVHPSWGRGDLMGFFAVGVTNGCF